MGVRYQMRKLLEKMREEDETTDIEIYPGVNDVAHLVRSFGLEDAIEPTRLVSRPPRRRKPQDGRFLRIVR